MVEHGWGINELSGVSQTLTNIPRPRMGDTQLFPRKKLASSIRKRMIHEFSGVVPKNSIGFNCNSIHFDISMIFPWHFWVSWVGGDPTLSPCFFQTKKIIHDDWMISGWLDRLCYYGWSYVITIRISTDRIIPYNQSTDVLLIPSGQLTFVMG